MKKLFSHLLVLSVVIMLLSCSEPEKAVYVNKYGSIANGKNYSNVC